MASNTENDIIEKLP